MPLDLTEPPPTSSATTGKTEPDLVAAILSAEGTPDRPLSFHVGRLASGIGRPLLLLATATALVYGAASWRNRA
jgi:hypothetical protein